ncbi:LysR family transcriptional regulator substrate-binding protein [Nocardioides convexus]|uniref:LysR family transcriptional regulator substrate-binding protein n=1 Tax=Nocardioides convexus TaxID=2712224 RepID=UPI002418299E|nr:LysR family transcriptional regulator substrate-binding protein [Nocardioides convexus]
MAFVPGATPDKWARVWRERHPRIPLDLSLVEESAQRAVLDEGTADLALARLPVDLDRPTPLHCVRLYDESPVVVASREHLVAALDEQDVVDPADLSEEQAGRAAPVGLDAGRRPAWTSPRCRPRTRSRWPPRAPGS